MPNTTAIAADPICREHLAGREHPERPERFDVVYAALRESGLLDRMTPLAPRAASEDELALCHRREYLALARHDAESGYPYLSTGDTDLTTNSWEVASRAAGSISAESGTRC